MIQGTYYKEWSTVLGREMEFKVYGHAGVPVLADGFISGVAALCAVRLCPAASKAAVFTTGRTTECPMPLPSC